MFVMSPSLEELLIEFDPRLFASELSDDVHEVRTEATSVEELASCHVIERKERHCNGGVSLKLSRLNFHHVAKQVDSID